MNWPNLTVSHLLLDMFLAPSLYIHFSIAELPIVLTQSYFYQSHYFLSVKLFLSVILFYDQSDWFYS